ncbi:MAG TPA: hypothetical protein HA326_02725 [Thermoplasmata archaeon]|nr:hypothetical protein [Thermoplasmata archaeon]
MAATETRRARRTWPIVYERRMRTSHGAGTGVAWALFLGLGLPFALMTGLTVLARGGIYVELFRPLWQPWPPDLLKPFLGLAVFAATLAYLAYRVGQRRGLRVGAGIRRAAAVGPAARPQALPIPPPPPPDDLDDAAWGRPS